MKGDGITSPLCRTRRPTNLAVGNLGFLGLPAQGQVLKPRHVGMDERTIWRFTNPGQLCRRPQLAGNWRRTAWKSEGLLNRLSTLTYGFISIVTWAYLLQGRNRNSSVRPVLKTLGLLRRMLVA